MKPSRCAAVEWRLKLTYYLPSLSPPWPVVAFFVASVVLGVASFIAAWGLGRDQSGSGAANGFGIAALFALLGAFILFCFSSGMTIVAFYLPALFASPWSAVAAAIVGLLLFWLRKKNLGFYGAIEIVGAGVTLVVVAFNSYGSTAQRASALLGAIYFLIRGLDNAEKGELLSKIRVWVARGAIKSIIAAFGAFTSIGIPLVTKERW